MSTPLRTVLALETSCDECSCAVVQDSAEGFVRVLSNAVYSQIELHQPFGGVVPEIASRNHLDMINPIIQSGLSESGLGWADLDAIAVTNRPGLIGALLVGVSAAKALAYTLQKPLLAVDHLQGHLHSLFIKPQRQCDLHWATHAPLVVCLVSGGHTQLYFVEGPSPAQARWVKLSESRDDAAGEAFDKCAKLMGLPYPGGKHIERLAQGGRADAFPFPRPLPGDTLEFSFSGLKTAMLNTLTKQGYKPHVFGDLNPQSLPQGHVLHDLCASLQEAIVDTLVSRVVRASQQKGARAVALVGGVSANGRLRLKLSQALGPGVEILAPDAAYCTDNGAMIGAAALYQWRRGEILTGQTLLTLNAYSSSAE